MKLINFILFIMLSTIITGCKGSIYDSMLKDNITGTYHLEGTKIEKRLCHISNVCEEGEVLSADTTEMDFKIGVEYLSDSVDSLRFRGLESADVGKHRATSKGRAFARLNGVSLKFEIEGNGARYSGKGKFELEKISLNTTNYYRGSEIEFNLTGEKIDDEVLR